MLETERKERERDHEEFKIVMQKMYQGLKQGIQQENSSRKQNQVLLLRFLEETCLRIERSLS